MNEAWKSADSSTVKQLSAPGCVACANFAATADSLRAKRQHYASDAVQLFEATALPESTPDRAVLLVPAKQLAAEVVKDSGGTVRTTDRVGLLTEATVVWTSTDGWRFASWTVQERTPLK